MIEKVRINTTLKAGNTVWEEGAILESPLPPDILNEIHAQTGTVSVIKGTSLPENKLVFVAERVKEEASTMTTMMPIPDPVTKPRPKLRR